MHAKIIDFCEKSDFETSTQINNAAIELGNIFVHAADLSLKRRKPKTKAKTQKKWYDKDLASMRKNLIDFGKVYSSFPKDPYVKNHFYKLYREYNKSRKYKSKKFKSDILEKLETLNEDNPKLYWKLIKDLQDQNYDSATASLDMSF